MTQALLVITTENCRPTSKSSRWEIFPASTSLRSYETPLAAIDDGWRLIAPPVMVIGEQWEWWCQRETAS